ncbi:hypothetical protein ACFV6E_26335 [Streptomyces sp. NPDC059785]|uniref:hypothetical protein n=1 Tax=unclassified Streptomyces TaxID=2593676 RepID=UPI0036683FE8
MTEANKNTSEKSAAARTAGAKAQRTADKATAPATRTAKTAADKADDTASAAKAGAARTADVAKAGAARTADAAKAGAGRTADAASGAVHSAAKGVEVGRQAIVSASGQVAAGAKTAWLVISHRKLVAAGVGAGLTALSAVSFVAGRRAERHTYGPVTRLTGGRF